MIISSINGIAAIFLVLKPNKWGFLFQNIGLVLIVMFMQQSEFIYFFTIYVLIMNSNQIHWIYMGFNALTIVASIVRAGLQQEVPTTLVFVYFFYLNLKIR